MIAKGKLMAFVATVDAARARKFYEGTLGLHVLEDTPFALVLESAGTRIRVQKVEKVEPHPYTALGWDVDDVAAIVKELTGKGVSFNRYPGMQQDDLGIWTSPSGARVAWFCDPDRNVLSLSGG
ncbi:MAG TPA: VOC family protein [Polyangiaceae bacterium]|jgi:catechol 2,3-dioxygenase-like lactoylglutathione lyase family enzyme|nr:VOC family protein [Polyangiaceae bacterium]